MSRLPPRGVFLPVHATGTVPVRAHRGLWPHRRPLRICRARLLFADRFRAGAGRRSGSGWRQGRVRWGRPLLSRPRGAVGSGPAVVHAAVESAAVSAVAWSCGCQGAGVSLGLDGCEVRLCDPCARVRPCVPCVSRVCSGSPGVFYFLPAVESAAVSAVAWSCGCQGAGVSLGLD